jgi:hypothetical protein
MDAIREAISNVSLYEVKAAVRKAQNGMLCSPSVSTWLDEHAAPPRIVMSAEL